MEELRRYILLLDIEARLKAYGQALNMVKQPGIKDARYFLLSLDPSAKRVTVTGYKTRELSKASREYLAVERKIRERPGGPAGAETVLVSVESMAALRRAYPNYFLDTHVFLEALRRAVS
ncbi:MAG: hypothetical protein ACREMB_07765 [Candidatus Rokuibacteriota bacterium]